MVPSPHLRLSIPTDTVRQSSKHTAAVNCISSSTINACLEAAKKYNSPVMIQVSNGGGAFMVGEFLEDANAAVAGSVALAMRVRSVAKYYGIPVVLHSDHCAKKLLPWLDGMLKADEEFYAKTASLFSLLTCSICPRNPTRRTLPSALNTSSAWPP